MERTRPAERTSSCVSMPKPGPTSTTKSSLVMPAALTIFSITLKLIKKFCPNSFFAAKPWSARIRMSCCLVLYIYFRISTIFNGEVGPLTMVQALLGTPKTLLKNRTSSVLALFFAGTAAIRIFTTSSPSIPTNSVVLLLGTIFRRNRSLPSFLSCCFKEDRSVSLSMPSV